MLTHDGATGRLLAKFARITDRTFALKSGTCIGTSGIVETRLVSTGGDGAKLSAKS